MLRHGLRARLGRPRSRLVVPFTVLAMLVGGLCAAAAGARLGWGGSTGLSAHQISQAQQIEPLAQIMKTPTNVGHRTGTPAWFVDYLSIPVWDTPVVVLPSDTTTAITGPTYVRWWFAPAPVEQDGVGGLTSAWPASTVREFLDAQRARLAGLGWTVTDSTLTATGATLTVRNGDLIADLVTFSAQPATVVYLGPVNETETFAGANRNARVVNGYTPGPNGYAVMAYRATPTTVRVFAVLAGLLGAVLTYLLIGWLNRRTGRLSTAYQRALMAGLALAAALAAPAAAVCAVGLWMAVRQHSGVPIRYWGSFTTGDVRAAALAAAIVLAVTVAGALLARPPRPAPEVAR
jgi:hypothetical protein